MTTPSTQEITRLLHEWGQGDQTAFDRLLPVVYDELRRMAQRHMARQPAGHTLQTTALIHEAYLKLADQKDKRWQDRAHFFAVAAQAMRHILVDYARTRGRAKRGGDAVVIELDEAPQVSLERSAEIVALDDALTTLAALDKRKSQVVELRFFGGLTEQETAEALKISEATVRREWRSAKLWLLRELSAEKTKDEA